MNVTLVFEDDWCGPGFYAGCQIDTDFQGNPIYANYYLGVAQVDRHKMAEDARARHLGTPRWCDTRTQLREGRYA